MATSPLLVISERIGQTTLAGNSPAMTSVSDWSENFTLPVGFGDCMISSVNVQIGSIQTVVAAGAMRGPSIFLITNVVKDFVRMDDWHKQGALSLSSMSGEIMRPVMWRADEVLNMAAFSEDAGAGNTSITYVKVRVMRLRNQG